MLRILTGPRRKLAAIVVAAIVAGSVSTLVQLMLWWAFTDAWLALLARDARLAAALVLGPEALAAPETFDAVVLLAATVVHGVLSLAYAALLAVLVDGRSLTAAFALGAAFGLALYVVNLHGFTALFPWFAPARGWITVAAHLVFGVGGAFAYRAITRQSAAQSVPTA